MKLLVDVGNSRVKWALATVEGIEGLHGFDRPADGAHEAFRAAWGHLDPAAVVACSVAGPRATEELRAWVARTWNRTLVEVRPGERRGAVVNGYRRPDRLGADRWANLLGARATLGARDTVIVDAGTAVTVDALRADGRHAGGAILAGLAAARAGLHAAAPALPGGRDEAGLPADDTAAAIGAGTLVALAGGIERVTAAVGADLGTGPALLITGGDAERLLPWLTTAGWRHEPLLTVRGLLAAVDD